MAVRRCLTLILSVGLTLWAQFGSVDGERWSRQVSNSEWIPLADPRTTQSGQSQVGQNGVVPAGASHLTQVQSLTLPPVLQQQYQQQLQQLQKTQESIQNLLMLQQQLRAQQQILQAQAFLPNDFNNPEEDKQALHRSTIANLQAVSDLAPEVLIPPLPSPDAIPPIYQAQNFFSQNPSQFRQNAQQSQVLKETQNVENSSSDRDQDYKDARGEVNQRGQSRDDVAEANSSGKQRDFTTRQGGHYKNSKQFREQANQGNVESHSTPSSVNNDENGEEEVQLVYVPAETLAQRGQQKAQKGRGRKSYLVQQQHLPNLQQIPEVQSTPLPPVQQIFANQLLQQLQRDQEEKDQLLRDQRLKELARLDEEQKELERQAKLHQETVIRELELQRQREEEKEKELARLEEAAKHRELERLRELREKQGAEEEEEELARQIEAQKQEELERQKIAEIQAKEERQRQDEVRRAELDRLAALEKYRELQLQTPSEKRKKLERQRQMAEAAAVRATAHLDLKSQWKAESEMEAQNQNQARAQALVRNQQQHHTEVTRNRGNRVRGRQRQKNNQVQQNYQSVSTTTTPSPPNQPPLSVYMGTVHSDPRSIKVSDVLRILKDAKTISVLDSVESNAPQIFVGPTNLDPPSGYAKFDLPYLSSIDNNRVERRVDKLPFFVAPLSFDPPPGYSKIPFPAPHIGSVVVNTVDNLIEPQEVTESPSPSPTPLIEPNSYIERAQSSTPNVYDPRTTSAFSQETSSTPNYNTEFSTTGSSGTRYRYKQFHVDDRGAGQTLDGNKPVSSTTAVPYQEERSSTSVRTKQRPFYDDNSAATTPSYYTTHNIASSSPYYQENFASSTPNYQSNLNQAQEEPTKEQDLAAQLALINRELAQHRYNDPAQRPTAAAASHQANSFHDVDHASLLAKLAANEQRSNLEDQNWRQRTPNVPTKVVDGPGRITVGPTQYSFPAELPPISPQLPGLVNSLLEESDPVLPTTTPVPTTTTTTTARTTTTTSTTTEAPTSTFRIRGRHRGRVVSTRPTTTTVVPPAKSSIDRIRRPLSRTRSRHTTTTESYAETAFEPTKPKYSGTTQKYNYGQNSFRKPTIRNQRFRGRNIDRSSVQSETQNDQNIERHDTTGYDDVSIKESHLQPGASATNSNSQDGYPSSTVNPIENYPSSPDSQILRETVVSSTTSLDTDAYLENPNYSQSVHPGQEGPQFQTDFQTSSFGQTGVEESPANGFNYQSRNEETLSTSTPQSPRDYSFDSGRIEGLNFNVGSSTVKPNLLVSRHENSQSYEAAALQAQPGYGESLQSDFGRSQSEKTDFQTGTSIDLNIQPVYDQFSQGKQEEYAVDQQAVTDVPLEVTTQVSTTEAPLTVRQRARGRTGGGRVHQDPAIQVRSRNSQDDYVRFNPVNQDTGRSGGRQGTRIRPRVRTQQGSQVQTEGNEYVRIQAPTQYQKSSTTTTTTTTSTTTTTTQVPKEELEYGFIRTPNFNPVHPIDRFHVPAVTFRPTLKQVQVQTAVPSDDVAVEVSPTQAQILKNRQKYHVMTRRPLTKTTTTTTTTTPPTPSTTLRFNSVTSSPDNKVYTVRPKTRPEEPKPTRIRGKIRKSGRKRTTTTTSTTESTLDSNNELPLDENYPRIVQTSPELLIGQQALYEENLEDDSSPLTSLHGRPAQLQETENLNFPQQLNDFVINFGVVSGQGAPREEYDQTQLASNPSRKYSQSSRIKTHTSHLTSGDIEGAESQWSTKLTRTSFQPSYSPNHVGSVEESMKNVRQEKSDDSPEIITAGPEVQSITVLVTSNDADIDGNVSKISYTSTGRRDVMLDDSADLSANTENIGEYQMDSESDDKEKNVTAEGSRVENVVGNGTNEEKETTTLPTTIPVFQETLGNVSETTLGNTTMTFDRVDDTIEPTKPSKKIPDPLTVKKSGQRRRRVRVRVRPTVDDIATAESQHFSSAMNGLVQDGGYKYNHFRDSRSTTEKSLPSTSEEVPQKSSILEDFLEEMLNSNDDTVPVRATSTTTNFPGDVWMTTTTIDGVDSRENSTHVPTTLQEDISTDSTENETLDDAEDLTTMAPTTMVKSREFVSRYHRTKSYHSVEEVEDLKVTRNKLTTLDSDDGSLEDVLKGKRAESSSEHSEYQPEDNEMTMYRSSDVWKDVEPAQSSSKGFSEDHSSLENSAEGPQNEERLDAYTTERYDFHPKSRGNVVYHSSSTWRDVEPIRDWSKFSENRTPVKNPTEDLEDDNDDDDEEQREFGPTRSRTRKMYSSSITRVHPTRTSSRLFQDQDSSENVEDDSVTQDVAAEKSHPKNHRTKWSEVKNLSDQSLLDYSKFTWDHKNKSSSLRTSTSEPEIMTSTNDSRENGNSNVKILTDYVQAIFRSMKNDEGSKEKANFDSSKVTEVDEELSKMEKPETSSEVDRTTEKRDGFSLEGTKISEKFEGESQNDVTEVPMESSTSTSVTMSVSVSTGKVSTKNSETNTNSEEIKTTTEMMRKKVESEASTTLSSITRNSESDSTSSVPVSPDELTTELPAIENSHPTRNSTGSNLGKILRTSTTTKVSHMTEICYRGRCVMTKPKREIRVR